MDRDEVITHIVEAVTQVQRLSGRATSGIGPGTRPIGGLEGFDSLNGLEAVVMISSAIGRDIPDDSFISEDGRRALTISEIADNISGANLMESRA